MNGIPRNRFGQLTWAQAERKMYSRFTPNREVMDEVNQYVLRHNICNISAMHIRTTDLSRLLANHKKKPQSLEPYFRFVEGVPSDEPVFLITDSPDTQQTFIDKYGQQKILVYSLISRLGDSNRGNMHHHGHHHADHRENNVHRKMVPVNISALPDDFRFTSLQHTLVDVLIAAHRSVP